MASDRHVGIEELLGQRDWLRRLARHLADQESDGEDLAQDAWLAAHRSPPEPGRSPRPWFAQVLRNLRHSHRRDEIRRARREREYQDSGLDGATAVDEVYGRLELQRFLVEEVMALEPALRTVVILHYFEDLDSARVAQLTNSRPGTVRWRLKGAIDQLRRALDRRHGGNRRAWLVVLAPDVAPRGGGTTPAPRRMHRTTEGAWIMASTKTKALLVSLAAVGLLAISGALLWWGPDRTRAGIGAGTETAATAATGEGNPPPNGTVARVTVRPPKLLVDPEAAPSEQTAAGCAIALSQTRDEAEAYDREARGLIPAVAFDTGAPNSRLRTEVTAQIERQWPAAAASHGITHDVECRGWACRLQVILPAEESPEVEPRLRSMSTWVPVVNRLRHLEVTPPSPLGVAVQWAGRGPSKDALAGKKLEQYTFFFGAPPGASGSEGGPAAAGPLPGSLDACRQALAATRERLRSRLAQLGGFRPLATLFAGAQPAPELTARVQTAADRAGAKARVQCRSGICRMQFDAPPDRAALARLREDDDLGERIRKEQQTDGAVYLTVGEMGGPLLARMRAPLRETSFFVGCPDPEREGNVLLRLMVPETGIQNENGVFNRASVQLAGGTLASSPAALCLTDRMAALLATHELPHPMVGHLRFESWLWRPGQPPTLVTPPPL